MVAPSARFPNRAEMGTRVLVKSQSPLCLPGMLSTAGHFIPVDHGLLSFLFLGIACCVGPIVHSCVPWGWPGVLLG